ncbi:MAG TPA: DNA polymerase [Methanofastidiosum sp.]|nr:DNA polymerase [Methanofastidiosum sp.]
MEYTIHNYLCQKCGIYANSKSIHVIGRGDPKARILILGEALGQQEAEIGQPFVGSSGQLMQHYLDQVGIISYISNAVKCHPTDLKGNNRTPTPREIEFCRAFTLEIINQIKPKVIITVGKIALQQLMKLNMNIETARGKQLYLPELDLYVVPTYHPAYLMRTNDKLHRDQFVSDLRLAKQLSELGIQKRIKSNPRTIEDPVEIKRYLEELLTVPAFAFDLETTGLNHRDDKITDISFCHTVGQGVHIRWSRILEYEDLLKEVFLADNEKIGHNIGFEKVFLKQLGYKMNKKAFDTMLAYHAMNMSSEGKVNDSLFKLETLAWFLTSEGGYKNILSQFGGIKGYQDSLEEENEEADQGTLFNLDDFETVDKGVVTPYDKYLYGLKIQIDNLRQEKLKELKLTPLQYYSALDSDVTFRLYKYMKPQIDKTYKELFYDIIMPFCDVLAQITVNGIKLDFKYIDKVKKLNDEEIVVIKNRFFKKIGYEFNLNSTKEMHKFLYQDLGLIPNRLYITAKSGRPSADEAAITFYSQQKPILKNILEYRTLQKQNSTYLEGFKKQADTITHRIYPSYFQLTATGRASSSFHTMPKDNKIRNIVVPEKGCKFLVADQSQVELRVLSMMADDMNMKKAFESGHDFHTYTACVMFNIPIEKFDKKKNPDHDAARSAAKNINFGIIYGLQARTLAEDLGIAEIEALNFMNKFFMSYPNVKKWINENEVFALRYGYVETLYGRRRYLPKVASSNDIERSGALRQATNTRIQGTAADITNISLIKFQNWIDESKSPAKIVGTIHDSILVETPEDLVYETSQALLDCMTKNMPKVTIPLKVDLDIQDKWTKS